MRPNQRPFSDEEPTADETRLRDQIREQLRRHGQVDVTKIGIDVHNFRVLLWGSVASERERNVAAEVARSVAGSRHVLNRIHVCKASPENALASRAGQGAAS